MRTLNPNTLERVENYITEYQKKNGKSPSYRQIMHGVGMSSLNLVQRYVLALEREGRIERTRIGNISVPPKLKPSGVAIAPLVGSIACGQPVDAVENIEESFALPRSIFGNGDLFIFSGLWGNRKDILYEVSSLYQVGVHEGRRQTDALKDRLNQDIAKLDEKMKRLTRMRLEDEISKEEFLEYKSEIEKEREKVVQQRLAFEAGVETRTDSDSVEGKIQNFLLQKMDFTEHYVDRDIISQFVDTVIPRSETCYEWYMDFDLIEKPNEKKKMVWSFKIDYNEAKTYRKEREGMLRPNQWEDLIVRVYI